MLKPHPPDDELIYPKRSAKNISLLVGCWDLFFIEDLEVNQKRTTKEYGQKAVGERKQVKEADCW